jgi:hypothetical protein
MGTWRIVSDVMKADSKPFVTGDVVSNPVGTKPFKVIFKQGSTVLSEWPVNSIEEGEQQIIRVLRSLGPKPAN